MAAGDTVTANNATAASGTFTVQPAAGVEWVIHNIFVTGAANLKMTDGTTVVTLKAMVAGEWQTNIAVHVTHGLFIQITDTSAATNNMHYDGIQTI